MRQQAHPSTRSAQESIIGFGTYIDMNEPCKKTLSDFYRNILLLIIILQTKDAPQLPIGLFCSTLSVKNDLFFI